MFWSVSCANKANSHYITSNEYIYYQEPNITLLVHTLQGHLQSVVQISYNDKPLSYCARSMPQPRTHEFGLLMSHTLADLEEVLPCSSRVFDCLLEHQQQPVKFFIIDDKCYLVDPPDNSNIQVSDLALR